MIYVIIPVKRSTRFAGKNGVLAPYTRGWLAQELIFMPDRVAVYTVGRMEERPGCFPPPELWPHFEVDAGGMQEDMEVFTRAVMERDDAAVFVQVLLTQPLRERGLLRRAVLAVRGAEAGLPVVSGLVRREEGWRRLDERGGWAGEHAGADDVEVVLDGAVFAWRNVPELLRIFDRRGRKVVLERRGVPLVDVDWREDVPRALAAVWGEMMVEEDV